MIDNQSGKPHARNIEFPPDEKFLNECFGETSRSSSSARKFLTNAVLALSGIAASQLVIVSGPAFGNEIHGNHAWQFRSVGERTLSLQQLDLMMRRNAGGYNNFFSNTYNTYVAGDQVNCSVSATAAGNTGTSSASGSSSSPTIGNTPSILAQATGSSLASQGWPSGGSGGVSAPLNSAQSNASSPQSATVSGTNSTLGVNGMQSSGGVLHQGLNTSQSNLNSPQNASVSGSTACGSAGSGR